MLEDYITTAESAKKCCVTTFQIVFHRTLYMTHVVNIYIVYKYLIYSICYAGILHKCKGSMCQNGFKVKVMGNGQSVHSLSDGTHVIWQSDRLYRTYFGFVYIQYENRFSSSVTSQCKHKHSVSIHQSCETEGRRRLCETRYFTTKMSIPPPLYLSTLIPFKRLTPFTVVELSFSVKHLTQWW